MKICLSEFTYKSFEELLEKNFKNDQFILIDSEANIISGEGKPDIALVSYELMFKALKSESFFERYLALIDGCSFVQGSWAGTESPQAQALISHAKIFSHGGGLHAIPIATYVFAQILRSIKSIDAHIELQREKSWKQMMSVGELTDMTIGITGFGGIGQEVARIAKAFRMKVYATKRTPVISDNLDQLFKPSELDEMLPLCDFVINCLPSSEETYRIFSKSRFELMKTSSMFINVGRGESVDEVSLAEALQEKKILCAAIDTTDPEPLDSSSPLWTLENCFITPHDSAWGPRAPLRAVELFIDNYRRLKEGKKLLNQV
jgi:phosphoglycerate dehydrogenase-like enzyme